ncbi:hypothetical protein HYPSUDRAFT_206352 [Hypholoma sublateritium FD-334 SS-4]|uniref:Uncharacterized protein n=1 Tax=Hypholoma sublateritium (strain FD-334 SS-4) TaxID=945553 RepID=A0A0D2KRP6_HYPSF|nr:hypothetical protein HYPSUDRAFT_206352 [Hypholoma sublateritium FD-334 SS-4]
MRPADLNCAANDWPAVPSLRAPLSFTPPSVSCSHPPPRIDALPANPGLCSIAALWVRRHPAENGCPAPIRPGSLNGLYLSRASCSYVCADALLFSVLSAWISAVSHRVTRAYSASSHRILPPGRGPISLPLGVSLGVPSHTDARIPLYKCLQRAPSMRVGCASLPHPNLTLASARGTPSPHNVFVFPCSGCSGPRAAARTDITVDQRGRDSAARPHAYTLLF